jgi:hypothetical protein
MPDTEWGEWVGSVLVGLDGQVEAPIRDALLGDFIRQGPRLIQALNDHVVIRIDVWVAEQVKITLRFNDNDSSS